MEERRERKWERREKTGEEKEGSGNGNHHHPQTMIQHELNPHSQYAVYTFNESVCAMECV